jgi:hypothetical protein
MGAPQAQVSSDSVLEDFSQKHRGYAAVIETETASGDRYTAMKNVRLVNVASSEQGMVTIAVKDQTGSDRQYTITGYSTIATVRGPHTIEVSGPGGKVIVKCSPTARARKRG